MHAFLVSAAAVAVAEIGDKTQLLALMLAARYRAPVSIILGIFFATVCNHLLAAWFGSAVAQWIGPLALRWVLGLSFLGMAVWILIPDKADDEPKMLAKAGAFVGTLVSFFLIEIGDKTQIATIALAARFHDVVAVASGTTLGMMIADVPVVFVGEFASKKLPLRLIRFCASALFAILALVVLLDLTGIAAI